MSRCGVDAVQEILTSSPVILGEGAVIERLRRMAGIVLDDQVVNSALIYDPAGRAALGIICRQYMDIGLGHDLPLLVSTPTWRASRERIAAAGLSHRDLNGDNYRFLDSLRQEYGVYGKRILVAGLMSCRGDAYRPGDALPASVAEEYHSWQAGLLADAGVDLLLAATLPALSEAVGLARAMAATGQPYLVSFVVRPEGVLLDGTPLDEAVSVLDSAATPRPLAYLINCTHASLFRKALYGNRNSSRLARERIVGLLANTAPLSPEELDNCSELVEEPPLAFGDDVGALFDGGMRILGGCCGTDDRHIAALAQRLAVRVAGRAVTGV